MYILANMWFTKLIVQFFFSIDKIVFNFISAIYDLMITIARTSVLTQADIADMADRIYKLLAIFMIFKVTLSLITYVVNPDNFSDKNKGVSKLSFNIVFSLALLILTPYIFNYAYQFQTIILEDNSLATLIFGGNTDEEASFFNTAGDDMAYITMSAFFTPNTSLGDLHECTILLDKKADGSFAFNEKCKNALSALTNDNFSESTLTNYIAGVEHNNLGLLFRQDLATATNSENEDFIMEYKYIFSTVVGVVVILLLITFCMDIAVRSIKLAFLQLVAPIPIISYVDPKSGKDGMFKKWYEMCFKTYISLFIRLIALYFAVYIISRIADMKMFDIVNGSYQTNCLVAIFMIIGALMFAKQLPKILEGLGIKLDGDGKFFLNPFKKFEEQAIGGKRITGAAGGLIAGIPRGNLLGGAVRGFTSNGGFRGGFHRQADVNRKIGEARMNGAGFFGSRFTAGLASEFGMENADLEGRFRKLHRNKKRIEAEKRELDAKVQSRENRKKSLQDQIAPIEYEAKRMKSTSDKGKSLVDFSKDEIKSGKADTISTKAKHLETLHSFLSDNQGKAAGREMFYYKKGDDGRLEEVRIGATDTITAEMVTQASEAIGFYTGKQGAMEHLEVRLQGRSGYKPVYTTDSSGLKTFDYNSDGSIKFEKMSKSEEEAYQSSHFDFDAAYYDYSQIADANDQRVEKTAKAIKAQSDELSAEASKLESSVADERAEIAQIDRDNSEIREKTTIRIDGEDLTIAEAERRNALEEKILTERKAARQTNIDAYHNRRYGPPGGGKK